MRGVPRLRRASSTAASAASGVFSFRALMFISCDSSASL
jgi:hypothetical protein